MEIDINYKEFRELKEEIKKINDKIKILSEAIIYIYELDYIKMNHYYYNRLKSFA